MKAGVTGSAGSTMAGSAVPEAPAASHSPRDTRDSQRHRCPERGRQRAAGSAPPHRSAARRVTAGRVPRRLAPGPPGKPGGTPAPSGGAGGGTRPRPPEAARGQACAPRPAAAAPGRQSGTRGLGHALLPERRESPPRGRPQRGRPPPSASVGFSPALEPLCVSRACYGRP